MKPRANSLILKSQKLKGSKIFSSQNVDNQLMAIQEKNSDSDDIQTPASQASPTDLSLAFTDSQGDDKSETMKSDFT